MDRSLELILKSKIAFINRYKIDTIYNDKLLLLFYNNTRDD